jgi:hypothetical protein
MLTTEFHAGCTSQRQYRHRQRHQQDPRHMSKIKPERTDAVSKQRVYQQ